MTGGDTGGSGLTLLSLLVLGSVWLTCRSEYRGGFRRGLLMSQGTDSVRTNLAGLRRERGKRGWRGGEERGKDIKAQQEQPGSPCACTPLSKEIPQHFQPGVAAEFQDPPAPRAQPTPPGCEAAIGGSSSCHGPSVSRGSASTVLFLAGAFLGGEGKESAQNAPSREIFLGKSQPDDWRGSGMV